MQYNLIEFIRFRIFTAIDETWNGNHMFVTKQGYTRMKSLICVVAVPTLHFLISTTSI